MNAIKEQDIFDRCMLSFKEKTGIRIQEKKVSSISNDKEIDGLIAIKEEQFRYEVKDKTPVMELIRAYELLRKDSQADQYSAIFLLGYTTVALRNELRKNDVFFIDSVGNCYINQDELTLLVELKDSTQKAIHSKRKKAFNKSGLKVVLFLLNDPKRIKRTNTTIAEETGVSARFVGEVMEELTEDKFVIKVNQYVRRLNNARQLIQKWVYNYGENLRPTCYRGEFYCLESLDYTIQQLKKEPMDASIFVGGELAADCLTNYLKPQRLTLYTNTRISKLIETIKIVPGKQKEGEVEVFEKFWGWESDCSTNIVDPILVYADLLLSNNHRNYETAERILKDEIRNRFLDCRVQW